MTAGDTALDPWRDPQAVPYVRIDNVAKRFGPVTAVDNISLGIYKGELFALLGASGCGKTTLLRMLAGFETPTAGRILIDGEDLTGVPPYQRPVNMMFQSYALFPHMTVAGNVGFGLKQDGLPKAEITDRVAAVLELVQLGPLAGRKPHQLSGGQRQRVALARSLVKRPKVLLLDEPLGALDRKLREQTQFELVNIQEETGVTFIVVTHDQEEAMTLASRIAVMDQGQLAQVGEPAEIYESPNSRFIADFVGSVNIFAGRVVANEGGRVQVVARDGDFIVQVRTDERPEPGAEVWVAVRPEKIRIAHADEDRTAADNRLAGTILEIAYLGGSSLYHVELADGQVVRVTAPNRERREDMVLSWEDPVSLSWSAQASVLLRS